MEIITKKRMMLFTGTIHPALAHEIADCLSIPVSPSQLRRFASGEIYFRAEESVRGADVFVVQTHYEPVNEALMEQLIMIDAMKRASAKRITAVIPYYGYSRQDHKALSREPISAKLVADLLSTAGADRVISVDLHSGQIQGYFDYPFDHLTALPILSNHFKDTLGLHGDDLVVVAPDAGRIKTSEKLREYLHADLAFLYKRRSRHEAHKIEEMAVVGEVRGPPVRDRRRHDRHRVHDLQGRARARRDGCGTDLRRCHPRHLQRQGAPVPGRGADRTGGRHEHAADPRGAHVRQAEGALDRAADRERSARRVRGQQRQRDLRRRQPGLIFSGKARQSLEEAPIEQVVVTNTLPIPEERMFDKLKVLSIAPLIASGLRAVFEDSSVSEIFGGANQV